MGKITHNPFEPETQVHEPAVPIPKEKPHIRVNEAGQLVECREIDGEIIVLRTIGSLRTYAKKVLYDAALSFSDDPIDPTGKTNLELSALHLAKAAAAGNKESITELLDRVMGKPKQTVENQNLNLSLDDVLAQAITDDGEITQESA